MMRQVSARQARWIADRVLERHCNNHPGLRNERWLLRDLHEIKRLALLYLGPDVDTSTANVEEAEASPGAGREDGSKGPVRSN